MSFKALKTRYRSWAEFGDNDEYYILEVAWGFAPFVLYLATAQLLLVLA